MRKFLTQVSWLAILVAAAAGAWGQEAAEAPALTSVNPEGAPVRVTAVGVRKAASPQRLGALKFRISNTSQVPLRLVELTANVYGPKGGFTGFHAFTVQGTLQPGEERYFHYSNAGLTLEPGQRVELVPTFVWGFNQEWDLAHRSGTPAQPGKHPKSGPTDTCDARCDAKDAACAERCSCGVNEFSCSCGIGTFSYSC